MFAFLLLILSQAGNANTQNEIASILEKVNEVRKSGYICYGQDGGAKPPSQPLRIHKRLNHAAKKWSKHLVITGKAEHGNTKKRIAKVCGRVSWGEVIAFGNKLTPDKVVNGWLKSKSGHCGNILSNSFRLAGIGKYKGHPVWGTVWTMKLASACPK